MNENLDKAVRRTAWLCSRKGTPAELRSIMKNWLDAGKVEGIPLELILAEYRDPVD